MNNVLISYINVFDQDYNLMDNKKKIRTIEFNDSITYQIDFCGFIKSDINIEIYNMFEEHSLVITAERNDKFFGYLYENIKLELSENLDLMKTNISLDIGILSINIKKFS